MEEDDERLPLRIEVESAALSGAYDRISETTYRRAAKNVWQLGLGFLLLFSAFQTTQNFATTVMKDLGYSQLGYQSLSIIYLTVSVLQFGGVPAVEVLKPRLALVLGAACYTLYIASLIEIVPAIVLAFSFVLGVGAVILWTGQGVYLVANSTPTTTGKNSGVFWGLLQTSLVLGNLIAYFLLSNSSGAEGARTLYIVLSSFAGGAVFLFSLLRPVPVELERAAAAAQVGPKKVPTALESLMSTWRFLTQSDVLFFSVFMFYSGVSLSYFAGDFPLLMKKDDVGLVMASLGAAEVVGANVCGRLFDHAGERTVVTTIAVPSALGLVFAWLQSNTDQALGPLAFIAAICIGFGDAGTNTLIQAWIGRYYASYSSPAFATYKFMQALAATMGFYGSPYLSAHSQILIAAAFLVAAFLCIPIFERLRPRRS